MKTHNYLRMAVWTVVICVICGSSLEAEDATWLAAGTEDWNEGANWQLADGSNFTPESTFEDNPVIANGGIAYLDAQALGNEEPFALVDVRSGGLEIRDGGQLEAAALSIADATNSLLLTGTSGLVVTGDATTTGVTRIVGPNVDFSVGGDYTVGGDFQAVVTGAGYSAVKVGGAANVSGTLRPEFDGVTPALGDAWPVIDATSVVGTFDAVDTSLVPPLESGVIYTTAVDAGAGNLNLVVTNTIELAIDRRSGAATLRNLVGDPISVDSYTVSSPAGVLNPADNAWTSLADSGGAGGGWAEGAADANSLNETRAAGATTIEVGSPVALGSPVIPMNFAVEDVTLSYSAEGVSLPGLVSYEGVPFNLVLNVDPATGEASIANKATVPIEFDGYAVQSPTGALKPADGGWISLADSNEGGAGWQEANPTANALAELNPVGTTTLAPDASLALGSIFDASLDQDLSFSFFLAGGTPELRQGFVGYGLDLNSAGPGPMTPPSQLAGDVDNDGQVGFADFLILSANFGMAGAATEGDIDGDGQVGFADFLALSANFGTSAGAAPVPEPASGGLLGCAALCLLCATRRSRRNR